MAYNRTEIYELIFVEYYYSSEGAKMQLRF